MNALHDPWSILPDPSTGQKRHHEPEQDMNCRHSGARRRRLADRGYIRLEAPDDGLGGGFSGHRAFPSGFRRRRRARYDRSADARDRNRISHLSSNSRCVPMSRTLPRSRTRMASELTRDDRRWEIAITVRPWAIFLMLALTIASLSGSSALVASSRIRMRGSTIRARAIASRWRWPPDRLGDPS